MPDEQQGRFFNLELDVDVPGRWYFHEPATLDGREVDDIWAFTEGTRIDPPGPLLLPIQRPGNPLDYTTAGVGSTPILSERAAKVFREWAPQDIQLFPVEVEGQAELYHLLVAARKVRCIDDAACAEARYFSEDGGRPDRAGKYEVISGLRIDKSKVGDARVFKLWGWSPALIIAGEIKNALQQIGFTGGRFEEV